MDSYSAIQLLQRALVEHRMALEEEIVRGKLKSFEEYKEKAGEISGILFAEREILDMLERIEIS